MRHVLIHACNDLIRPSAADTGAQKSAFKFGWRAHYLSGSMLVY
jgi:hypothetical protein